MGLVWPGLGMASPAWLQKRLVGRVVGAFVKGEIPVEGGSPTGSMAASAGRMRPMPWPSPTGHAGR
jgi:hypothetical protein